MSLVQTKSNPAESRGPIREVGIVVFPDFQVLDVTGPLAVFDSASQLLLKEGILAERAYRTTVLAITAGPVQSSAGLSFLADRAYQDWNGVRDTLLVAGGYGAEAAGTDNKLVAWLAEAAGRVRRMGSICTGALLLAKAGLLEGRHATTHWAWCAKLAAAYPSVTVDPDAIYVQDGNVFTSAGVTSGMDLALALVEQDWGRELALKVARWLVMFAKRPGGQSQFSAHLAAQVAERPPIRALQNWILDHLSEDLSVPALAERAAMSPRNFARVFLGETRTTPAAFVETARLEASRRKLEETTLSIQAVAHACGFGNAERLRRTFQRRLGVAPQDYRDRFRSASGSTATAATPPVISMMHVSEDITPRGREGTLS